MKKIFILFIITILIFGSKEIFAQTGQELVDICTEVSGDTKYLKDFQVKLEAGDPPPQFRQSIVLSKNTIYKFSICNSKDYPGEAIFQLFDSNRLIVTSHNIATGEDYPTVQFKCSKTGVYHIFMKFKDGKEGMSVAIMSFVKKF